MHACCNQQKNWRVLPHEATGAHSCSLVGFKQRSCCDTTFKLKCVEPHTTVSILAKSSRHATRAQLAPSPSRTTYCNGGTRLVEFNCATSLTARGSHVMPSRTLRYRCDSFAIAIRFRSLASCQMAAAMFRLRFRAAMIFQLAPSHRFRIMKSTTVGTSALSSPPSMSKKAPFPDEPPRVMSKIWRLRHINWCMMCGDMCFVVHRADFSRCSLPANCWETTQKNSTESRLSVVVDRSLTLGVALAPFLPTVASNVSPNRRALFPPPAPYGSAQEARSGHTAVRARVTFKAHTQKNQDIQNTSAPHCALRANERWIALSYWLQLSRFEKQATSCSELHITNVQEKGTMFMVLRTFLREGLKQVRAMSTLRSLDPLLLQLRHVCTPEIEFTSLTSHHLLTSERTRQREGVSRSREGVKFILMRWARL